MREIPTHMFLDVEAGTTRLVPSLKVKVARRMVLAGRPDGVVIYKGILRGEEVPQRAMWTPGHQTTNRV